MFDGQLDFTSIIHPVEPACIGKYWDRMKPGLERLKARGCDDWRPEDLYHSLKNGNSVLLINPDKWDGFGVCTRLTDFDGDMLWIWAAYTEPGADVAKYWQALRAYARSIGIQRLCFSSPIVGWGRRARHYGFVAKRIVYQLDNV